jgi:hypothetical protein
LNKLKEKQLVPEPVQSSLNMHMQFFESVPGSATFFHRAMYRCTFPLDVSRCGDGQERLINFRLKNFLLPKAFSATAIGLAGIQTFCGALRLGEQSDRGHFLSEATSLTHNFQIKSVA